MTPLSGQGVSLVVDQSRQDQNAGINQGNGADWMGPGNPMYPLAPPEVRGRTLDFPIAANMTVRPRANEPISFETLQAVADSFDILRTVIETRKDQMKRLRWSISPKDKVKATDAIKARIADLEAFFASPDKEHDWPTWLGKLLEDMFVIDAATIYPRMTMDGRDLHSLVLFDGATIKRVIDDWGRTPAVPAVAYQQVFKGMPSVNYTADQLLYRPRNPRNRKLYGFSPTEQVLATINIALRREAWQLRSFTEGAMPDYLVGVPETWTADQIRQFQQWFDAIQQKSGVRFIPGGMSSTALNQAELFGKGDEWLARVICFAFNLSPAGFVAMMNRSTSETQKEQSEEDGLEPVKQWVKSIIDFVLVKFFKVTDLEFVWPEEVAIDPKIQSDITDQKLKSGRITLNEARLADGEDPYGDDVPEAARPMIYLASGAVPISVDDQIDQSGAKQEALGPPPAANDPNNPDGGTPPPGNGSPRDDAGGGDAGGVDRALAPPAFTKAARAVTVNRPAARKAERAIRSAAKKALAAWRKSIAEQVTAILDSGHVAKAANDAGEHGETPATVTPVSSITAADAPAILAKLRFEDDVQAFYDVVDDALYDLATDTAVKALASIGVRAESDLVNRVNEEAAAFTRDRAAELVGKKWVGDVLVDSTTPGMAITESTREMLRATITDGLTDNIGTPAIAKNIEESFAFSEERAKLIARTEVANANGQSKLIGWKEAAADGLTLKKSWLVSGNDTCDICLENQAAGPIPLDDDFPSGDDAELAHPRCECVTVAEVADDSDNGSNGDDEDGE